MDKKSTSVINRVIDLRAKEVSKNRAILASIIKTVIFCSRQEIAVRGHRNSGILKDGIRKYFNGETTVPKSFSGPIGTQLSKCEKLPVVNFKSSECEISEIERKILSKDQQHLLDISYAVKSGSSPEDLSVREPGPLSHSSPAWFYIKKSKYFTNGPEHVFEVIKSSRFLPENLLNVIDPVSQRNALLAHPGNALLSMLIDKRDLIRELGFRRIIKARNLASERKSIRSFQPPNINFPATHHIEMIHWNTITLSPPPLLRRFSNQEIWSKVQSGGTAAEWNLDNFQCHTQAMERCVKLVTEASQKAFGSNFRDGFIRTTLLSRSSMPSFSSKSYFKVPKETEGK
ncbi:hypothetical protein AVEN_209050-1 [Araneus ventricosus]|uniref:Uncharacterized protein n=1 Tax=Araneus ventricosus TaxID=182803 RepID=A0A4Y2KLK7_ARAVE|nr:hypothetical protein AVEN_209050-1 [Araneus ventricosus]